LVDFLNRQMERTEVVIVEARQYEDSHGRVVVPSLFGFTEEARLVKKVVTVTDAADRRTWDVPSFLAAVDSRVPQAAASVRALLEAVERSSTTPRRSSTRLRGTSTRGATCRGPEPVARDARDRAAAAALAAPRVQRQPRPFFCQIEAVETAIWLTEVAPHTASRRKGKKLPRAPRQRQPRRQPGVAAPRAEAGDRRGQDHRHGDADRVADDQRVSRTRAARTSRAASSSCTPGLTIKDRLRVLQPNDPDSYYLTASWCRRTCSTTLKRAKIVITNYHAFKLRERVELSPAGGRCSCRAARARSLTPSRPKGRCSSASCPTSWA
jgi:hypothetical protein